MVSKHAKSIIGMLRVLETSCNKSYINYRFGSKIFEKTQTIVMDENKMTKSPYQIKPKEETKEEVYFEEKKEEISDSSDLTPKHTPKGIFVPTPTDIPEIDPSTVTGQYKEHVLGTRSKLNELISLINEGAWKRVSNKNK